MAEKVRRSASYECDLTDGCVELGVVMPRSPAAPAEADPGSVGSSISLRLMTIRMGGIRCAASGMNGDGSHGWARQAEVSPIHNGHGWMILFRGPMMAVSCLAGGRYCGVGCACSRFGYGDQRAYTMTVRRIFSVSGICSTNMACHAAASAVIRTNR
jgi:hypothetical protein